MRWARRTAAAAHTAEAGWHTAVARTARIAVVAFRTRHTVVARIGRTEAEASARLLLHFRDAPGSDPERDSHSTGYPLNYRMASAMTRYRSLVRPLQTVARHFQSSTLSHGAMSRAFQRRAWRQASDSLVERGSGRHPCTQKRERDE